jgi:hypothetical protein
MDKTSYMKPRVLGVTVIEAIELFEINPFMDSLVRSINRMSLKGCHG